MIKLCLVGGSTIRKIFIDKRKITMLTPETGNKPITMDLDKINESDFKDKMTEEQFELMKEIAKLNTEQDNAVDIKKDFQSDGWRSYQRDL